MRELEAGFSVSETSEDGGIGGDDDINSSGAPSSRHGGFNSVRQSPDILGLNSHFLPSKIPRTSGGQIHSGMMPDSLMDMEARVRAEQQRSAMQAEVAQAKSRYLKRVSALERDLEKARSEKRELQHMIESQKHTFKLQISQ
jgi:hypothetical protein